MIIELEIFNFSDHPNKMVVVERELYNLPYGELLEKLSESFPEEVTEETTIKEVQIMLEDFLSSDTSTLYTKEGEPFHHVFTEV